jgi:hypothetical protein
VLARRARLLGSSRVFPLLLPASLQTDHDEHTVQQAENELTFHGEFLDTFDQLSVAFELDDARQFKTATSGATSAAEQGVDKTPADSPSLQHHEQLIIHQTCASAYTLLLQRRCASLREVSFLILYPVVSRARFARGWTVI